MLIERSDILLTSQHVAVQEQSKTESLKIWVGDRRPDFESVQGGASLPRRDSVELSLQARDAAQVRGGSNRSVRGRRGEDLESEGSGIDRFITILMELLTGKKVKLKTVTSHEGESVDPEKTAELSQAAAQASPQPQPARVGFGLEYDARETYLEAESLNFKARGMVRTADGAQIDFSLELAMQRMYFSEESLSLRLGDAALQQQDPMIITFDGAAAQLTNTKFSFDLNSDGTAEQLSFVGPNSGFIALDRNGDGRVNDGSELFGTVSGNGFQDLAVYDQDKNGWIDDNDPVFSQLKVWTKDVEGADAMTSLKISGVGALYLGGISTQFDLKTVSNVSLGTLRASSVYLKEDGNVGTIQDVDLTL